MLKLPHCWRSLTGGAIALHLLKQVSSQTIKIQCARNMIIASLDVTVLAWFNSQRWLLHIEELPNIGWRVGNMIFAYFPIVDDNALNYCTQLASKRLAFTSIVPNDCEMVFRQAIGKSHKRSAPAVISFNDFISWRILSASLDQKWPTNYTIMEFLRFYNNRAIEVGFKESMLADIY